MLIDKRKIIFLDTNILSDIGRFDEEVIRNIVMQLSVDMQALIAVTPFNILEVEKIPDRVVKNKIKYFLNLSNAIFLKGMDVLFDEEIKFYLTGKSFEPMQFITTLISKSKDGKPFNYLSVLENLLSNHEYQKTLLDHYELLDKQQTNFQNKMNISSEVFTEILFKEHLNNIYPSLSTHDIEKIQLCCPSYMAYAYSLYDKIGSKGLRKKAAEMNDTAMSYIFPYVGIVATEKRQATIFNNIKQKGLIPSMEDTIILKHSDIFVDGKFQLKEALSKC